LVGSLAVFTSNLNKKGTLANELTTDTVIFKSVQASVLQLQQIADTATAIVSNLKMASSNPNSTIGVLLHDEESGARLKETIKKLESSSIKLDEDLEAAQHSFYYEGILRTRKRRRRRKLLGNKTQNLFSFPTFQDRNILSIA
jgi:phospholipid/cholesterol/gamma-HCH transport system substrate-binding protein